MTLEEANEYIKKKMVCTDYPKQKTFVDISGSDVNYLHVIKYAGRDKYHVSYFLCQCICGEFTIVDSYSLRHNQIKSCGCKNKEFINNEFHLTHGDSKRGNISHLYMIWSDMKYRCTNPKNRKYYRYGARGIKVCDKWLDKEHGYENFKSWALENGYKDNCGLSIDRIDVDGNYCPENCRWADNKMQQNNKRNTIYIAIGKRIFPLSIWAEILNISKNTIRNRIENGWSIKDAVFTIPGKPKGTYQIIEIPEKYEIYNKYDEFIKSGRYIEYEKYNLKINILFV